MNQKMEMVCPECNEKNTVLYLPSNKLRVEVQGTRAGKSSSWRGRGEKVEGNCEKCNYKFKVDDL